MAGGKHKSGAYRRARRYKKRKGIRRGLFQLMALLFGNKCLRCGKPYSRFIEAERLSVDHVIPVSKGGLYKDMRNLQPLCVSCNGIKDNDTTDYRPFVPTEEQLWAAVGKEKK